MLVQLVCATVKWSQSIMPVAIHFPPPKFHLQVVSVYFSYRPPKGITSISRTICYCSVRYLDTRSFIYFSPFTCNSSLILIINSYRISSWVRKAEWCWRKDHKSRQALKGDCNNSMALRIRNTFTGRSWSLSVINANCFGHVLALALCISLRVDIFVYTSTLEF